MLYDLLKDVTNCAEKPEEKGLPVNCNTNVLACKKKKSDANNTTYKGNKWDCWGSTDIEKDWMQLKIGFD